ncbi:hypothetical protein KR026_000029 [Drosophila bipectinata]|nr:hypothetical protein KR026_000029 [Drosophila bipectinata]
MENNKKVCQLVDYYEKFMLAQLDVRVEIYPIFEPMQEVEEIPSSTKTYDGDSASELNMMGLSQDGDMSTDVAEKKLEDTTKDEAKDGKQDEPIPEEVMEVEEIETKNSDETSDSVMEELRKLIENSLKCESELFLLGLSQDGDMPTDVAEEELKDDTQDEPQEDEQEDSKRESPIEVMEDVYDDETSHSVMVKVTELIEHPDETSDSVMVEVKELIEHFLGLSQEGDMSTDVEENLEDDTDDRRESESMHPDETSDSVMVEVKELIEHFLGLSQDGDMSSDVAEEELEDDTQDEPKDDEPEEPIPEEVMEDVPYKESSDAEDEMKTKNSHETSGSAVENVELIKNSSKCEIEKPTEPRHMLISGKRAKLQISKDLHRTLEETL